MNSMLGFLFSLILTVLIPVAFADFGAIETTNLRSRGSDTLSPPLQQIHLPILGIGSKPVMEPMVFGQPEAPSKGWEKLEALESCESQWRVPKSIHVLLNLVAPTSEGVGFALCFSGNIWSFDLKRERARRLNNDSHYTAIAISQNGSLVAGGDSDGRIRVFDVLTGKLIHSVSGSKELVSSLTFSDDGKSLCSGNSNGTLTLWSIGTTMKQTQIWVQSGSVTSVLFGPERQTIVTGSSDRRIRFWKIGDKPVYRELKTESAGDIMTLVPNSNMIVVTSIICTDIEMFDWKQSKKIALLEGHRDFICGVVPSSDGRSLISASHDSTIRFWDLINMRQLKCFNTRCPIVGLALMPDGQRIVTSSNEGTIETWRVPDFREQKQKKENR